MADSFVHEPENFQAVITFQPNHFSDLFLDQYFHWTFLSLLIGSSHELLHSALTGTCSSVWTIFGKLHTVKHYLRFNFYCTTNHYVGSKLVSRSNIQKLYIYTYLSKNGPNCLFKDHMTHSKLPKKSGSVYLFVYNAYISSPQ